MQKLHVVNLYSSNFLTIKLGIMSGKLLCGLQFPFEGARSSIVIFWMNARLVREPVMGRRYAQSLVRTP